MDLSILIPTHRRDVHYLEELCKTLYAQAERVGVSLEILSHIDDGQLSTGEKSNQLMDKSKGKYLCRFDADDLPSEVYMDVLAQGIKNNVDCVSLRGIITTDGDNPLVFEHSLKYKEYATRTPDPAFMNSPSWVAAVWDKNEFVTYIRYPNHLNCVRASIAKQFKYPDKTISEDTDFATQMFKSGLLKTEHYDPRVIYHYRYKTKK